jgi:hypothetical protein
MSGHGIRVKILQMFLPILLLAWSSFARAETREELVDALSVQLEKIGDALLSVKNVPTAEKAVADLEAIVAELSKMADRAGDLGQPSAEVRERTMTKLKTRLAENQKRMIAGSQQLQKAGPEAVRILQNGMAKLTPKMQRVIKVFSDADQKQE